MSLINSKACLICLVCTVCAYFAGLRLLQKRGLRYDDDEEYAFAFAENGMQFLL